MSALDAADPQWAALRAFVADAWAARSSDERHAFAGAMLADAERVAAGPAVLVGAAPAAPEWGEPDADLALQPATPLVFPSAEERSPRTVPRILTAAPEVEHPDAQAIDEACARAERLAALSGAVVPVDLVRGLPATLQHEVLGRLAAHCDRTLVDAGRNDWCWVLGIVERRDLLRSLDGTALAETLAGVESVPTDAPGRWLRAIARGERIDPAGLAAREPAELQSIVQAFAWAQSLDPALEADLAAARRAAEVAALLAGYDRLLADGFVGRDGEAARLDAFVADLPAVAARPGVIPILGVSGIGGAGKSTLLAHLLRPQTERALRDPAAPLIVALDFDRRSFVDGGELEWSFEVSRQIGLIVPAMEQPLAGLRAATRDTRAKRGEERSSPDSAMEAAARYAQIFENEAGELIRPARLSDRGMLLVIDTFEEWQRGAWSAWDRDAPALRVLEWVSRLAIAFGVSPGLIVSGRAPAGAPGYVAAPKPIALKDLLHADARGLLERLGVSHAQAGPLAKLVGGNPLSLKIAARYMRTLGGERLADLSLDADDLSAGLGAALRQGLLYRRFLDHIPDPEVRKLAHPGLALRQVTPELIVGVLAEPCGLGQVTPEQAEALCQKLEREAWLVDREGGALVHRFDVRRSMLHAMRSDPAQAPRVRAVHEAAIRWYERERRDPVEAAYHRLSLGQVDGEKGAGVAREVLQQLIGALDDFEPAVRALLRDRLGMRLGSEDVALLPKYRRRRWAEARASDLLSRGQPSGALRFWRKGGFDASASPWYVQAAFQAPDWGAEVPFAGVNTDGQLGKGRLAYAYLLAFSRTDERRRQRELALVDRLQEEQTSSRLQAKPIDEILLENLFFRQVASPGAGRTTIPRWSGKLELQASGLTATDVRRLAAVVTDGPFSRVDPRLLLSRSFHPSLAWLDRVAERLTALDCDTELLRAFRSSLTQPTFKVAEVLGDRADQFAESVRGGFAVMPPTPTLLRVIGCRGDDPEWRVPIRETLAEALADPAAFRDFAQRAAKLFDVLPVDLTPDALTADHRVAPRGMWLRLVEYADRCGVMGALLGAAAHLRDVKVDAVAAAYGRWDTACAVLLTRRFEPPDTSRGETR